MIIGIVPNGNNVAESKMKFKFQTSLFFGNLSDVELKCLLNSQIEKILECGQLLDEDLQILLHYADELSDERHLQPNYSIQICVALLFTFVSVLLSWHDALILVACLTFVLSILIATSFLYKTWKVVKYKSNIDKIIKHLKLVTKLNHNVFDYLQYRQDIRNASTLNLDFAPFDKKTTDFVHEFVKSNRKIFELLISNMRYFSEISHIVSDEYRTVCVQLEYPELDLSDVRNFIPQIKAILDTHILLSSSFLASMGIAQYFDSSSARSRQFTKILNTVSTTTKTLMNEYEKGQTLFSNARYGLELKNQFKKIQNKKVPKITNNIQETVISCITKLSVIIEKAQLVLQHATDINEDGSQKNNDLESMTALMWDLRNDTQDICNKLDILTRMYSAVLRTNEMKNATVKITGEAEGGSKTMSEVESKPNDSGSEATDEIFELYIPASEEQTESKEVNFYDDSTDLFAGLLVRELNEGIKKNQGFIKARNRWGLIEKQSAGEDNPSKMQERDPAEESVPKVIADISEQLSKQEDIIPATATFPFATVNSPPPPPPPMPGALLFSADPSTPPPSSPSPWSSESMKTTEQSNPSGEAAAAEKSEPSMMQNKNNEHGNTPIAAFRTSSFREQLKEKYKRLDHALPAEEVFISESLDDEEVEVGD